jgi:hypothetical protein
MGAGGAVMQEVVEVPEPEKTTQSPKVEVQVLEERLVEMPSEMESEEEENEKL